MSSEGVCVRKRISERGEDVHLILGASARWGFAICELAYDIKPMEVEENQTGGLASNFCRGSMRRVGVGIWV